MGENNATAYFYLLKKAVEKCYLKKTNLDPKSIHDWTGNQIKGFQEDLANELNERISERWFYMHVKPKEIKKLPRIDMLNILSRYVGCENWVDFKLKNENNIEPKQKAEKKQKKRGLWLVLAGLVALMGLIYVFRNNAVVSFQYDFCFFDKDMRQPITDLPVEVTLLVENESPKKRIANTDGCLLMEVMQPSIKFVVKAPYYKTDTIERVHVNELYQEIIELKRDDYALMIALFATSGIEDWEKRRGQLDKMIDENAVIFQIASNNKGMEMYNKTDFIDKLTTPLRSLGAIEIIETIYAKEKIISMRFIQK